MESWPVRLPPKSEPRDWVIWPKLGWVTSSTGSARLVWLRTLVKVPSARTRRDSAIAKDLLRPEERLTVPGPRRSPMLSVPKRPMGREPTPTSQVATEAKPAWPGQERASLLNQWLRSWRLLLALPVRSGRWLAPPTKVPEPVPEGSIAPAGKKAVRKGPLCQRKMLLTCQPPMKVSTRRLLLEAKRRLRPTGSS